MRHVDRRIVLVTRCRRPPHASSAAPHPPLLPCFSLLIRLLPSPPSQEYLRKHVLSRLDPQKEAKQQQRQRRK